MKIAVRHELVRKMPAVVLSYLDYLQIHQLYLMAVTFDTEYFIIINLREDKLIFLCDDLRQLLTKQTNK